jgi:hypothetical protein
VYRSWLGGSLQNKNTVRKIHMKFTDLLICAKKGDEITLFGGINYRYGTVLSLK